MDVYEIKKKKECLDSAHMFSFQIYCISISFYLSIYLCKYFTIIQFALMQNLCVLHIIGCSMCYFLNIQVPQLTHHQDYKLEDCPTNHPLITSGQLLFFRCDEHILFVNRRLYCFSHETNRLGLYNFTCSPNVREVLYSVAISLEQNQRWRTTRKLNLPFRFFKANDTYTCGNLWLHLCGPW